MKRSNGSFKLANSQWASCDMWTNSAHSSKFKRPWSPTGRPYTSWQTESRRGGCVFSVGLGEADPQLLSCCRCGFKILRVGTRFWDFRFSQVDKTYFQGFAFVSWWEIHGKCCHVWCFLNAKTCEGSIQAESAGWMVLQGRAQEGQGATWCHSDHKSIQSYWRWAFSMPTTNALIYVRLYLMNACEQKLCIAVTKVCLVQPVMTALMQAYLVKVMEWKLTRGTFRPGLLQKVQQNSEEEVKTSFASLASVFANSFAYIHEGKTCRNNNWESDSRIHGFITIRSVSHQLVC